MQKLACPAASTMIPDTYSSAWADPQGGSSAHPIANMDVSAFVDDLHCEGFLMTDMQQNMQQLLEDVPEPAAEEPAARTKRAKSKQTLKLDRIRARNRLAQQRHRQKAKV
jgi:hypothetical protein